MLKDMTSARMRVLKAIHNYEQECKRLPSYRELGEITGLKSTSSLARHIAELKKHGHLEDVGRSAPRSLIISDKGYEAINSWSE